MKPPYPPCLVSPGQRVTMRQCNESFSGKSGRVKAVQARREFSGYSMSGRQDGWLVTVKLDDGAVQHFGWEWIAGARPPVWPLDNDPSWSVTIGQRVTVREERLLGHPGQQHGQVAFVHHRPDHSESYRGLNGETKTQHFGPGWIVELRVDGSDETCAYGWEWIVEADAARTAALEKTATGSA